MLKDKLQQAVILAGGQGSRLRPLTDTMPKPMIRFHGKPFLEYLIEMLREQGFKRILLLLGYLPEPIQEYFGDGNKWGLSIEYSISLVEYETGLRLKVARHQIDPVFLLMYCDNYWPMNLDSMWNQFTNSGALAQITVYRNTDKYTKDNVQVGVDGYVNIYDKSRTESNLQGVDIGFIILKDNVVDLLPDENISFEKNIYPELVKKRQLGAYVTNHRYYSVGSHERLPMTSDFLARTPTIFLDRDGILNKKMPRAQYVCSWKDWIWLPGAKEALALLNESGYRVILITNQPGIARGFMTEADLSDIHQKMKEEVRAEGGEIFAIYHCPHGWDEGCDCRKPRPGMLFNAQRDHHIDLSRAFFIGDDERDTEAGIAAGCKTLSVSEEMPLLKIVKNILEK
jgi:D-glycero-D-manno-heptose 1,7-bisphosphate phosphatase